MISRKNKLKRTLGQLGERGFIKKILPTKSSRLSASFLVPPGDDAAILKNVGRSVLSIDGITEETHFKWSWDRRCREWADISLGRALGWKLMGASLSDLAAMGKTRSRWAMIYLGAPGRTPVNFLSELQLGVKETALKYDCALAGGDTVKARDLSLVAAVGGDSFGQRPLLRSGAKPGDLLCVAGTVGDAAVGLRVLQGKLRGISPHDRTFFIRRFFQHEPMFRAGALLAEEPHVTSSIDLSDALKDSIEIIGDASKVGAQVFIENIPVSSSYRRVCSVGPSLLTGGEDYSLLFTLRAPALARLRKKLSFSVIGYVCPLSHGIRYLYRGRSLKAPKSFQHFS